MCTRVIYTESHDEVANGNVANFPNRAYDSYALGFPRSGHWRVRFNSEWNGYSADFSNHSSYDTAAHGEARDALPVSGNIGVGPYSVIILSQVAM